MLLQLKRKFEVYNLFLFVVIFDNNFIKPFISRLYYTIYKQTLFGPLFPILISESFICYKYGIKYKYELLPFMAKRENSRAVMMHLNDKKKTSTLSFIYRMRFSFCVQKAGRNGPVVLLLWVSYKTNERITNLTVTRILGDEHFVRTACIDIHTQTKHS